MREILPPYWSIITSSLENPSMKATAPNPESREDTLKHLGLDNLGHVYRDLPTAAFYEESISPPL